MQLAQLVETSRRVADTSGRRDKVRLLADFLSRVPPAEVEIATAYLCGIVPQRLGVGWAALRDATGEPASEALVELPEVSAVFDRVAAVNGKGAAAEKRRLLADLLSRLTRDEQGFLSGLLAGEVRHGALEGVMAEAVARAAQLPLEAVRRAVMMAGQLPLVARAALTEGEPGLARFSVQLFRPVQPMLAGSAEDESDALGSWARPRSSGSWMALACRSTRAARMCGCTLARSTMSPPPCPRWSRWHGRSRRESSFSRARSSLSSRMESRIPSRRR